MKSIGCSIESRNCMLFHHHVANYGCNCQDKTNCSLDNQCLTLSVIYEAKSQTISILKKESNKELQKQL